MDYKKEFIKFLEENECRGKFEKNLKPLCLKSYLNTVSYNIYIGGAFVWKDKESNFWNTLDKKWLERLNTLNNENKL